MTPKKSSRQKVSPKLPEWMSKWHEMIRDTEPANYYPGSWCKAFLEELKTGCIVSRAASIADIQRAHAYQYRDHHPWFKAAWYEAKEEAMDSLEFEARRRAVDGVDEPVFHMGEQCGAKRRYSDTLLIFLMKAGRPDKYREKVTVSLETLEKAAEQMGAIVAQNVKDPDVLKAIEEGWDKVSVE